MNGLQKSLLAEQQKFIKEYYRLFDGVMYSGFSNLFKIEVDFDWFVGNMKTIIDLSGRLESSWVGDADCFVVKGPTGNIDLYIINLFVKNLYENVGDIISSIKDSMGDKLPY